MSEVKTKKQIKKPTTSKVKRKWNQFALMGGITSLAGIFILPIFQLATLVFGIIAIVQIIKKGEKGIALAIWDILIGAINTLAIISGFLLAIGS